jgi:polysaccharide biosynthesis protein PslG
MKKMSLSTGIILLAVTHLVGLTISPLPYGINVHLAPNDVLAKVKAAGIAWIRIDVNWSIIEASQGKFTFSEVDRVANYAAANGLSVYATISSTPLWANGKKEAWWKYPATHVADWKNFVSRVVARYKNKIKYWGIWNEPNLKNFFALGKDKFVQQVLLPAAQTIRSADPAAFIVGPELAHLTYPGSEWYFWMKYILDNAGDYFDIISHHLYEDLGVYYMFELLETGDNLIPAVKAIVEESGQGNKPFWISETGWDTSKYSETMQSNRYLDMLHTRARKNYPQKVFFYEIIDDPRSSSGPFGILRSNQEAKPAYNTYKDYIAGLIPDPGNPDEEKINKKCYAEQTVNGGAPAMLNPPLQKLRQTRNFLSGYSESSLKTVNIYYQLNDEFNKIALVDSRVFNLGRQILERTLPLLAENGWIEMNRPLPEVLYRDARVLAQIIKNEYPDTPLAPLADLVDKNLALIGKPPPHDLLEFYMKKDLLNFKKSR